MFTAKRKQACESEREQELEGTGHIPSTDSGLSQSLSPSQQFLSACTTGFLRQEDPDSSRIPPSLLLLPLEREEGRQAKTTENPTGLAIMVSQELKGMCFL